MIDYNVDSTSVLIDSGASKSIFSSRKFFINNLQSTCQTIRFGNGPAIPVHSTGTVRLPCPNNGGMHFVNIPDCLYVPQQQFNILSVYHLKALGHEVNLYNDTMCWNTVPPCVQPIHWIHNLPYLLCVPESHTVMHVKSARMPTTHHDHYHHARLGHMSKDKQQILTKLGLVEPDSVTRSPTFSCEPCIEGTARKDTYRPVIDERASHPNHTLSCDLLQMPQPDLKQRKYMLVVVDEYTRYAFAFL